MKLADFTKRADEVIELGARVKATEGRTDWAGTFVDAALFGEFRAAALSLLHGLFGDRHPSYVDFHERVENNSRAAPVS